MVGILKMEDQLEVMDGLLNVRSLVFVPVTSDVLDHIAFQEGQVVTMNIPDRLNSHLFIMVTGYLRVGWINRSSGFRGTNKKSRATHSRPQKCRAQ